MKTTSRHMGRAISIIAAQAAAESIRHADVAAFGASGECHTLVDRGNEQRARLARRHARAVSGLSKSAFSRAMRKLPGSVLLRVEARIFERSYPF